MLVITSVLGQTCNQIWSYALHRKAQDELEAQIRFAPLSIHKGIEIKQGKELPKHLLGSEKLLNHIVQQKKGSSRLVQTISWTSRNLGHHIHFLNSWTHLNWLLNEIGSNQINLSEYFSFHGLETIRNDYVSLHARLGDYKSWRGGRYYRSPHEYIRLAQKISDRHNGAVVIIHTNEPHLFPELPPRVELSAAINAVQDLTMMASSQSIYGPPSTFSMTASNLGKTPLTWFTDENWGDSIEQGLRTGIATGFYRFSSFSYRDFGSNSDYKPTQDVIPSIWSTEITKIKSLNL